MSVDRRAACRPCRGSEAQRRALGLDVPVAQRGQAEALVGLGVLVVADPDQRRLEQAHDRGQHLVAAPGRGRRVGLDRARGCGAAPCRRPASARTWRRRGPRASAGGSGTACGPSRRGRWPAGGRRGRARSRRPSRPAGSRASGSSAACPRRAGPGRRGRGRRSPCRRGGARCPACRPRRSAAPPPRAPPGRIRPARRRVPVLVRHGRRHHSCALLRQNTAPRGAVPPAAEPGAAAPGSCSGAGDGGLPCRPRS